METDFYQIQKETNSGITVETNLGQALGYFDNWSQALEIIDKYHVKPYLLKKRDGDRTFTVTGEEWSPMKNRFEGNEVITYRVEDEDNFIDDVMVAMDYIKETRNLDFIEVLSENVKEIRDRFDSLEEEEVIVVDATSRLMRFDSVQKMWVMHQTEDVYTYVIAVM